jgi:hypothetical protein
MPASVRAAYRRCHLPKLFSVYDNEEVEMCSTDGKVLTREKPKYSKKNLSHWHFGKHKSHMD